MDRPDVLFTTTSDGVGIAYSSLGSGPPLLITHNFGLNHAELEWEVPSVASLYRSLAAAYQVIRFDVRTAGLSRHGSALDLSTSGMINDITTLIDAVGVDRRVSLLAISTMGPVAIEFAGRFPERVDKLVLCDTYPAIAGTAFAKFLDAQAALVDAASDGDLSGSLWRGVALEDEIDAVLAVHRGGSVDNPADIESIRTWDATEYMPSVAAPTLVLFARSDRGVSLDDAHRLVAGIPNAQLKTVEGTFAPYFADRQAVLGALGSFLGRPLPGVATPGRLTTVVFTDLVGSTEMVGRLGDESGRAAVRQVEAAVAALAAEHGGEVIKNLGDGSMVAFASTNSALRFAVAVQAAMTDSPMALRIGMAAGEPIHEDGDLHGAVVAQASRVADRGAAGDILVADSVRQLAMGKGFSFEDAGEAELKGFDEPVRLWRVRASG